MWSILYTNLAGTKSELQHDSKGMEPGKGIKPGPEPGAVEEPGASTGLWSRPGSSQWTLAVTKKTHSLHYVGSTSYYRVYVTFHFPALRLSDFLAGVPYKLFWDLVAGLSSLRSPSLAGTIPISEQLHGQSPDAAHSSGSLLSSVRFCSVLCLMTSFCMKNCSCICGSEQDKDRIGSGKPCQNYKVEQWLMAVHALLSVTHFLSRIYRLRNNPCHEIFWHRHGISAS